MSKPSLILAAPVFGTLLSPAAPSFAAEVEIDPSRSIFAVITHKGGLAASQAHDHLAAAGEYRARLAFDPEAPLAAGFELELAVTDLEIDDPETQRAWYPRLELLGILDQPFSVLSEKDRGKIRRAMLGEEQLDAAAFPAIRARVTGVSEAPATLAGIEFPYAVTVALEVRGKTVETPAAARFELAGGVVTVEAVGTFSFTDFGIEPYSAAFGLVRNRDQLHLYLHLEGRLPGPRPPAD